MTRKEAILCFEEWIKRDSKMDNVDRLENIEIYKRAIKALEQEPRWIPVSERLPKEGGYYLVTLETKSQIGSNVTSLGYFFGQEKRWMKSEDTVIAWQPLPKPYKESEEV